MDKRMTESEVVAELRDGMTIGVGGWGPRRKPMSLVREILRSDLKDLTIVAYGGPEVGLLAKYGKIKKLVYGFVSLDSIPLEPYFRIARQEASIPEIVELDEGMFQWGLYAASLRLPFLPTRAGLGSDVLKYNPQIKTVKSPYGDEELVAMPALQLDVALIHMNRGDIHGNGMALGPDPFFDDLFCGAAEKAYMSVEKIVETKELLDQGPIQNLKINRSMVQGVVDAPNGAHFTECPPDYFRDEAFQKKYATTAKDPAAWDEFKKTYLDVSEAEYQKAVKAND